MSDKELNLNSERISVGGREYIKSSFSKGLSEELKRQAGSFINILANKLAVEAPVGKSVSFWG